ASTACGGDDGSDPAGGDAGAAPAGGDDGSDPAGAPADAGSGGSSGSARASVDSSAAGASGAGESSTPLAISTAAAPSTRPTTPSTSHGRPRRGSEVVWSAPGGWLTARPTARAPGSGAACPADGRGGAMTGCAV